MPNYSLISEVYITESPIRIGAILIRHDIEIPRVVINTDNITCGPPPEDVIYTKIYNTLASGGYRYLSHNYNKLNHRIKYALYFDYIDYARKSIDFNTFIACVNKAVTMHPEDYLISVGEFYSAMDYLRDKIKE